MSNKTIQLEVQKKPKLRFLGFSGEWEEKELKDILSFKNGINASKEQYGHGLKFINVLDIIENDYLTYEKVRGYVNVTKEDFLKNTVSYGDILFQRSSETREEVGQANVYLDKDKEVTFGGFVIRGKKIGNYVPSFLNYLLQTSTIRKDITSRSGGSTRYNIGQESLEKIRIIIPKDEKEQEIIADFLQSADKWIGILQAQKEILISYKKGIMQKIFAQEIRFKDAIGNQFPEWMENKLAELGKFISGQGFSDKEQGGRYGIPFYKVSDMNSSGNEEIMTLANHYVTDEQISKLKYKVIKEKSIIFAKVGAAIFLERKRLADNFLLDNNMMAFVPNHNVGFIRHIFSTIRLSKYAQVGALPSYNSSDLSIIKITIPTSKQEQQKIADFLTLIDKLVDSKQQQITQAEKWKTGLMQILFV